MNIVFVVNRIKKFCKVTTRDTPLMKLSDKVSNGLSDLSRVYFYPDFLRKNKDSYTWSQMVFQKPKFYADIGEFLYIFHLFLGNSMIASIVLFPYLLNKD